MNALAKLHATGQSIWLDNIRRELLTSGTLAHYITDLSVTGLTSNPTIFEHAIAGTPDYDDEILHHVGEGRSAEKLFFEIALQDITAAADLFRPVFDASKGRDGFVSLEVSPGLANDTAGTIAEVKRLHAQGSRPNLFIKVPGTREGLVAIAELIFSGVSINVTLLFSAEHYLATAEAYLKGIERRVAAGLDLNVSSVASVFVSRWDASTTSKLPPELTDRLGIAVAQQTYRAYRGLLDSDRWHRLALAGAHPQRLLWASTGTKNPARPDTYYVTALAAEQTVNTMPEATLLAFADHGEVGNLLPADGADSDAVIARMTQAGIDVGALAAELQIKGRDSFTNDFDKLLRCIENKTSHLHQTRGGAKRGAGVATGPTR